MRVFIGSSSEAADKENPNKNMLLKIAGILKNAGAEPVLWNEQPSIFEVGKTTIENLEKLVEKEQIEAAVFIYSTDDRTWFRGEIKNVPRDNVVFEHGLFTAILGRTKAITVKVGDTKIPSDLHGVTCIDYNNPYHAELNIMNWVKKLLNDNSNSTKNNIVPAVNDIQESDATPKKETQPIELISIPKGTYKRIRDNQQITIDKPFSISKNLITQFIYASVMGNNPSCFKGADLPVENVTFLDAIKFCNKLSLSVKGLQEVYSIDNNNKVFYNKNANGYRLPFEIEWEYVLGYNNREIKDNLDEIAWYSNNSKNKTHNVGLKQANNFGICDLLGNVWEWCFDNYTENPSEMNGILYVQNENSKLRVLRGGSFIDFDTQFQKNRKKYDEDTPKENIGFRVMLQNINN